MLRVAISNFSFFVLSGYLSDLGDLRVKDIAEVESNIEIYQPKTIFFNSVYSSYYCHQEMGNQLKKRACKIELPLEKFPGDCFFYDNGKITKK